jgi:hypothetical protein
MQWGSKNLTKLIGRVETNIGYLAFNDSIPGVFEVCGECKDTPFTFSQIKRLLDFWPGARQSNEPTSLLNFTNCDYLFANLNIPENIAQRFAINASQAVNLIAYTKSLFRSYEILSDTPSVDYFRGRLI